MMMPPFLERRFGEDVPIYTIQSINLLGCLILPPIVASLTSEKEDFSIILPGADPIVTYCAAYYFFRSPGSLVPNPKSTLSIPCRPLGHGDVTHIRGDISHRSRSVRLAGRIDARGGILESQAGILDGLARAHRVRGLVLRHIECQEHHGAFGRCRDGSDEREVQRELSR